MKITMEIVEADLDFLAKTDVRYAELKAGLEHIKNTTKSVKGAFIVESNDSVAKSSEAFYASKDYVESTKRLHEINKEFHILETKRQSAIMRIDVWRTLEATRRKGNVQ